MQTELIQVFSLCLFFGVLFFFIIVFFILFNNKKRHKKTQLEMHNHYLKPKLKELTEEQIQDIHSTHGVKYLEWFHSMMQQKITQI